MSGKLAVFVSLLILVLIAGMMMGCGSGSSSPSKSCAGGPYNVTGNWILTVSGNSGYGLGVINSSGLAVFVQNLFGTPDTATLPSITGTCSFSGSFTAYPTPGSGGTTETATAQGTVSSAASISGTLSNGGSFSLIPGSPLSGAVAALSGNNWLGEIESRPATIWNITLSPSGSKNSMSFTGTSSTCNINGTFDQEGDGNTNLNVFDATITPSGTNCPISGTSTGVGFESDSDFLGMNGNAPGTYLYAISSNSGIAFEIFQQTP